MVNCPVCNHLLRVGKVDWHFICDECKYEGSLLKPKINSQYHNKKIDEKSRETGLTRLRRRNFQILVNNIKSLCKYKNIKLLEVGSAHGWFLDVASPFFNVQGIEPDEAVFSLANSRHKTLRLGYFPDALTPGELFDVIVFNDVLEHIPEINTILCSCYNRLDAGGMLLLNLPTSDGFIYKISKILKFIGFGSPFARLWQEGMPSPHLHYFNMDNLDRLLSKHGFKSILHGNLSSIGFTGLFSRITYSGDFNLITSLCLYMLIIICLPAIKFLPQDIMYTISIKNK